MKIKNMRAEQKGKLEMAYFYLLCASDTFAFDLRRLKQRAESSRSSSRRFEQIDGGSERRKAKKPIH